MTQRSVARYWQAIAASDGAGVKLRRALGAVSGLRMDPYLMMDNFSSDDPDDYIAGFPAHPHRGFETVTYIIDGHMKHRDHLGNEGDLQAGGVQWMTAGKGIIHEEMPMQKDGLLRGFQIWLNLPAKDKMQPAHYEDVPASAMPWQALDNGGSIKFIAGVAQGNQLAADKERVTAPIIADVKLAGGTDETLAFSADLAALVYVFEGDVEVDGQRLQNMDIALLTKGDTLTLKADQPARLMLLAGRPLNEPVTQYGPFVMNTPEEIDQAIRDYRNGVLTA